MVELTPDNAYVGARVYHEKEKKYYYIYKVNKKSTYIGTEPWGSVKDKQGKKNWTDFMKSIGAHKVSYGPYFISEAEVAKANGFQKKEKKQKKHLSDLAESKLKEVFDNRVVGNSKKTHKFILEYGSRKSDKCFILEAKRNGLMLISLMNGKDYFFYDVYSGQYYDIDMNKKEYGIIPWPEKEVPAIEEAS
jgi:hypothetical protein